MVKPTPFTDEENARLIELYTRGDKYIAICAELGKTEKVVLNQVARLGLEPRNKDRRVYFTELDSNGRKINSTKKILVRIKGSSYRAIFQKAKERNMYISEYVRELIEADIKPNK